MFAHLWNKRINKPFRVCSFPSLSNHALSAFSPTKQKCFASKGIDVSLEGLSAISLKRLPDVFH